MGLRVIATRFTADVSNYVSGTNAAAAATRNQAQASTEVGTAMLAMGAVAAVGIGIAVSAFANFDQKMSNVQAATNETADNMELLRAAAIKAGQDTAFSAGEAADAVTELAKAGVATADILSGGLTGALSLAAAGEISVGRAAEIAATAMTQFGIAGSQVPHIADLLASGANKAQGGVEDLAGALAQGGLVAASTGLSIEETVGTLSAFASAGLLGSDAGTSFKSMLQRLTPVSAESKREMDALGISAYDAQGQFIGMEKFAGNLQTAMKDLTPEQRNASQAIIFGSDAVRASNILYEQGAAGIGKWISEVDDSGAAARTAAIKLDNLNGDLQILSGSFETALIQSGSGANDVLRQLVQTVTGMLNLVSGMPAPVLTAGLAVTGLVAGIGLVGGATLVAVPKIAAFKASLTALGVTARTTALAGGAVGLALTAAVAVLGAFAISSANAANDAQSLSDTLDAQTGALTESSRAWVADKLQKDGSIRVTKLAGIAAEDLVDAYMQQPAALQKVRKAMDDLTDPTSKLNKELAESGVHTSVMSKVALELSGVLDDGQAATKTAARRFTELQSATGEATDATGAAAAATEAMGTAAEDAGADVEKLADIIRGFGSGALSARDAAREFEESIDSVTESIEENGTSLEIADEAGRANQAALDGMAKAALESAAALYEQTGNQDDANAAVARGRDELIKALDQFGITGDAAGAYADELGLIPGNIATVLEVQAADAQAKLNEFLTKLNSVPGYREVVINEVIKQTGAARGAVASAYATGGAISGPGTATSDSIPARLSNGEHVLTAEDVRAMGGQGGVYAFRRDLYQGFARGGAVRYSEARPGAGGGGSSSVTNKREGDTWNISAKDTSANELAEVLFAKQNYRERSY